MDFREKHNILIKFSKRKYSEKDFISSIVLSILFSSFSLNLGIKNITTNDFLIEILIATFICSLIISYLKTEDTILNFIDIRNEINLGSIDLLKVNEINSSTLLKIILPKMNAVDKKNLKILSDIMKCKADITSRTMFFNLKPNSSIILNVITLFGAAYIVMYNTQLSTFKSNNLLKFNYAINLMEPWIITIILIFIGIVSFQIYSLKRAKKEYQKYYALQILSKNLDNFITVDM